MWLSLLSLSLVFVAVFGAGGAPVNLDVSISTYLGDGTTNGINTGRGVAVDSAGNVYVVGDGAYNFGLSPSGEASKPGYILKLSASNIQPSQIFRFGSKIGQIRVREGASGLRIMVVSDEGVAVFDSSFNQQYVVEPGCNPSDCTADLGRDETLLVLNKRTHILKVFTNGHETANKDVGNKHFAEVAVDPVNKRAIYAYYFQSRPHNVLVQVPCVLALDYALVTEAWKDYCVSGNEDYETHNMADSRPTHIYYSDLDNKLYLAGYTDGGNSIFRYDPLDIANNQYSLHGLAMMTADEKVGYDPYTQTYGFHGAHSITFLARLNPQDGSMDKSEFLVTRLSSGAGNSVQTNAVAGGRGGTIVAAQTAVSSIEHRDTQTINGQETAGYGGADATLYVAPPDLSSRLIWHQFQKTTGHSDGIAVAANDVNGKTRVAFLMKSKDSEFVTVNAWSGTDHASTTATDQFALVVTDV